MPDGGQFIRGSGCPNGAVAEVCDGLNNDCAGGVGPAGVDNGNPGGGMACDSGFLGICNAGTTVCTMGRLRCNQNNQPQANETCNGLDDDCDGVIDEGASGAARTLSRVCYAGPPGTFTGSMCPPAGNAVGNCAPRPICAGVTQTCATGSFDACTMATPGQTFPAPGGEVCNGMDDDCDGQTDEGNPGGGASCMVMGQMGACAVGTLQCQGGMVRCVSNVAMTAEICDGVDNDCDGVVDEGPSGVAGSLTRTCFTGTAGTFTGACPPPGTQAVGSCSPRMPCAGVTQACGGAGGFPACTAAVAGQVLPMTETCNGIDDDCDGTVDDGNPGGGGACTVAGQQGACAMGAFVCMGGAPVCRGPNAVPETCNNVDDDCDGMTDEGVTRTCYTGPPSSYTGTCPPPNTTQPGNCSPRMPCAGVTQSCMGGMFPACTAAVGGQVLPSAETCDGIDNDCNGQIDNNVPGTGGMCVASGMGRCATGTQSCGPGGMTVCTPLAPIAEQCNGIDDDCDGVIDEGPSGAAGSLTRVCYAGPAGTFGGTCPPAGTVAVGNCAPRMPCGGVVQACGGAAGFAVCNAAVGGQTLPGTETCNGIDDDCDGTVDDGNPGGGGMCNAAAMGVCASGTQNCQGGAIVCSPGAPQTEQCNTVDENCNGVPNDVPARRCFSGPNVTPVTYTGTCPGAMCQPKGRCTVGQQLCDLNGNYGGCVLADGGALVTPANPPAEGEMLCNGIDDDCDGVVDDGDFDRDMDGVRFCAGDCNDDPDGGALQRPGLPDICDGIDNDCNGLTDGMNTACYSGPAGTVFADGGGVGQCRPGVGPCVNGMMPPAMQCVGQVLPGTEGNVCDRVDNDCDGKVDEDFDLDGDGVPSCVLCPLIAMCDCNDDPDGGSFVKPGAAEICDCQDNNCVAGADEGNVCAAAPCHDFDFDRATNCQGDCDDNNSSVGPAKSEVRNNGVDDDCDGQIDEDTDEDGDLFTVGMGDCDDKYAAVNPGAMERCDGFDNDCDGMTDEGFDVDGDSVTPGVGDSNYNKPNVSPNKLEICGNMVDDDCDGFVDENLDEDGDGVSTCNNDCNDHNANVHPAYMTIAAATEVCDGQDNDCDRALDEGFDVDGDGVASCFGDCDDNDPLRSPNLYEAPTPMGGTPRDENCNGQIDEGGLDRDMDGFTGFCGDCNDSDRTINPHGREVCDRVDNNCDGLVDTVPGMASLCAACFDNDLDGQTNCDGDCDDADPAVFRGASEVCDGKLNSCGASVGIDLDENGFRVCREDAGFVADAGIDAGAGGGGGTGEVDAGTGGSGGNDRPTVTTGCGCGSGEGLVFVLAAMVLARLRRRRFDGLFALPLVAFFSCQSSLTYPLPGVADAGEVVDAGTDAGFIPPVNDWPCPGFYPLEVATFPVPNSDNPFAVLPRFARTTVTAADAVVLDDGPNDVAAFVLRRDVPMDVDPNQPQQAIDIIAVREVLALDTLQGTPLVRDRTERSTRTYPGPTYTTSQNLTFATATNAFAVRNRLLAALSGRSLASLGALPQVAGAAAEDKVVVNIMFRIVERNLFISAAVTPLSKLNQNLPSVLDLTNGSSLGERNAVLQYRCENRAAPALKADFIFVVDNSNSMSEEQAALANASAALYNAFQSAGLDFRLGVVTTDSDVLRGAGFTRDLMQFQSDVRVGITGNVLEMGLEFGLRAVRQARMASLPPERRLRDDAGLVIVILSDEENAGLMSVSDYAREYNLEKAIIFSIVGPKPIGCARVGLGRANAGSQYIDAAVATGGSSGSICNPNLLEIVEEVVVGSLGAASRSPLADRPVSSSLAVRTGMPVPRSRILGFDYDPGGNTVLFFGSVPPEGTRFDAAYSYFAVIR
ncbi:MAG: hypothetical protein JNK82_40690, partial [Myxococcaceae bacterium]|nr:hypothetical protein [Myxococcaceae bacterium]